MDVEPHLLRFGTGFVPGWLLFVVVDALDPSFIEVANAPGLFVLGLAVWGCGVLVGHVGYWLAHRR